MSLHTLNKSPFTHQLLDQCLAVIRPDDALLLLEDGVYAVTAGSPQLSTLKAFHQRGGQIYVIEADMEARGLPLDQLDWLELIDYNRFVTLCVENNPIQSWF